MATLALTVASLVLNAQLPQTPPQLAPPVPPRVAQAHRFLARRGWPAGRPSTIQQRLGKAQVALTPSTSGVSTAIWQPLGPAAVISPNYGLVSGRVSSIAIDPADPTGNHVFIGTTGGGVWVSQNAAAPDSVQFTPLTDAPNFKRLASISIGAITVQPGGTGVILAGTGDPNDALDSYYGEGLLRSTDNGITWTNTYLTADTIYSMAGEGFTGFAWSTINPQLVVAAVSQSYEGMLVNADTTGANYAGLYYSTDAGATWSLARITDGPGQDVQGPQDALAQPDGNSATAVVWNPVRRVFIAAVRFHGYYQSTDGITFTRMTSQPGAGLTLQMCPTNIGAIGSIACPIFRGALAVNPVTGDTFAWTVDLNNQDQGLWQDACSISSGTCGNQTFAFSKQWNTAPLEANTTLGAATIANGDYNLVLAAVPSAQDTILLAGANDLWKCNLAVGCVWRDTTNSGTCMSAQVAPYQHALAWNRANPEEIYLGNDSGLWRSTDAIGESGSVCSSTDAQHFQNLNGALGSLAEVESMSQVGDSPYTMMAGLGPNGTAGVKNTTGPTAQWPQILGGEGGPVAIDAKDPANWYVNNSAGVSIYRCSQTGTCDSASFGTPPVVGNTDVAGDSYTMTSPAPFLIDPLDNRQVILGTCRIWRGPADGSSWTTANAISPILDNISGLSHCSGDPFIRVLAALSLPGGGEVIYAGLYGSMDGGAILGGHVFRAIFNPASPSMPTWQDLSRNPVTNDNAPFNYYGFDISSIFIDPLDATGNTVYVTVEGMPTLQRPIRTLYRSADGGAHWVNLTSNLPTSPGNSVVIDPQDANTAYVATDAGVFFTQQIADCAAFSTNCWSAFGAGLPSAPVVQLSAAPATTSPNVLVAGTYGRGIWQIPLATAGTQFTTASIDPGFLTFPSQAVGTTSNAQALTLTNTGAIGLAVTSIYLDAGFEETDNCSSAIVNAGMSCNIQVNFTPGQTGSITGQLTINANIPGGQITIPLSGTGLSAGPVTASPGTLSFGQVQIGTTSPALSVTVENTTSAAVPLMSVSVTPPFNISTNSCGTSLAANSDCAIAIAFNPTQAGSISGVLTLIDSVGTQTVVLSGAGAIAPTDALSPLSLTFPGTIVGEQSTSQIVTLTNNGDLPLTSISVSVGQGFQSSSNCGSTLVGNASCAITVTFSPSSAGELSGILTVSDAIRTQTVTLSGTGLQPPVISVAPTYLTFNPQRIGQTSAPLTLTISNTGGAPMANVAVQIIGPNGANFSITSNTCGSTLNNGSSCTVLVAFSPSAAGQSTATLVISSSTLGVAAAQVSLSGVGQAVSGITISPVQISFLQPILGVATAPQTAVVTNTAAIGATDLVLTVTPPFNLTQNTCTAVLAPGASCTAGIVFTPTSNGVVTGTLSASSSSFVDAATAVLTGTGGAAGSVQVQPASMTFATTGIGMTSAAQTISLTNSGSVTLSSFALTASSNFQIASSTCGTTLAAAASCTAQIEFAPTTAGQLTGNLTIASPALPSSTQVRLSGVGFDFSLSSSGQSSQTVASGQTASYSLTLIPANGSGGTFTFACGSLPANSTCIFNPSSETVAAGATGSVTLQIATGRSSSSAQLVDTSRWRPSRILPIICVLLGSPFAFRRRRRTWIPLLFLALASSGTVGCAGAGGGSGGTPPSNPTNSVTPAGTYSVAVSATANGVSRKVTLTLTVD